MLERQAYIFLLNDPLPGEARCWLRMAYPLLDRSAKAPRFLRRFKSEGRDEIRRAYPEPLKALGRGLYLGPGGLVYRALPQLLRTLQGGRAEDYKFEYRPVSCTSAVVSQIRELLAPQLREAAATWWSQLDTRQRSRVLRLGGDRRLVGAVLQETPPEGRLELVELLLGEESHPQLRTDFLAAATEGEFNCGPEVFSWLLGREDWNRCPGLIGLARTFVEQDPDRAWEMHRHPDVRRRDHLLDLLEGEEHDWLGWLEVETELWIREKLMTRIQKRYSCAELVSQLSTEKRPQRRRVLGWVLANWPCAGSGDRRHLKSALRKMEKEQRTLLRTRLKRNGRSFWRVRAPRPESGRRRF